MDKVTKVVRMGCIDTPPFQMGFDGLHQSSMKYRMSVKQIEGIIGESEAYTLIEMPAFTQSAKASLAIGMCWGMIAMLDCKYELIEPQQLKHWSQSKKGDGKEKVKQKVLERISLGAFSVNDNIVDAAGICLMFSDMIYTARHNAKNSSH